MFASAPYHSGGGICIAYIYEFGRIVGCEKLFFVPLKLCCGWFSLITVIKGRIFFVKNNFGGSGNCSKGNEEVVEDKKTRDKRYYATDKNDFKEIIINCQTSLVRGRRREEKMYSEE